MNIEYAPSTIDELENWMKKNCFNFNSYSINGNAIYEGCGIDKWGGLFIWYCTERGQRDNLKYFQTESEIVAYAFKEIQSDKWADAHYVGLTSLQPEQTELRALLEEMGIQYLQDEIPGFYGLNRPAYRTFVFGCDGTKTEHLKKRFYKERF